MISKLKDNLFMLIAMGLILWAVIASQVALARSNDYVQAVGQQSQCTEDVVILALKALNERTEDLPEKTHAEIKRINSQVSFISVILNPKAGMFERRKALKTYLDDANAYLDYLTTGAAKALVYPYPDVDNYRKCLNE